MNQYIFWLQVAMHDVMFIQNLKPFQYLLQKLHSFMLRKVPIFLYETIKCTPIAVLIDKIKIIRSLQHIDIVDDILALVTDLRQDIDLINGALLELWDVFELL